MRKFFRVLGLMTFAVGVLGLFGSALIVLTGHPGAGILFWISMAMVLLGWMIASRASNERCSNCFQPVNTSCLRCPHCGSLVI
jgi:hypothetical protein